MQNVLPLCVTVIHRLILQWHNISDTRPNKAVTIPDLFSSYLH